VTASTRSAATTRKIRPADHVIHRLGSGEPCRYVNTKKSESTADIAIGNAPVPARNLPG